MIKKFKLFEYISHYQSLAGDFHLSTKLGISEDESEKIYNAVANFYKENTNLSYLGSGSFGSVFTLDDKVLKITTDRKEVDNIEYLRKKNFHGIVNYYDIRKINLYINNKPYDGNLYSIIMDKVEPLNDVELECYRILYNIGYVDTTGYKLGISYTLDYNQINVSSAKKFRELNDGSRAKKIVDIIKTSEDFVTYKQTMKEELGDYAGFEFVDLTDLQGSPEFEETFLRFYDDILELLCDVIRYKLSLYDSHENNVGKDEEGHFKMIDLGFKTNRSRAKLKLKPIEISIVKKLPEQFILLKSEDGTNFKYDGIYDSEKDAIDDIEGDIQEKWIKLKNETILILFNSKYYYRIVSNIEEPEIALKGRWELKDPDQTSLNLWQNTKSKKS